MATPTTRSVIEAADSWPPDGTPDDAQRHDREESRRVARVNLKDGCDVFDLSATSINRDPASPALATTFANRGLLQGRRLRAGILTVQRAAPLRRRRSRPA